MLHIYFDIFMMYDGWTSWGGFRIGATSKIEFRDYLKWVYNMLLFLFYIFAISQVGYKCGISRGRCLNLFQNIQLFDSKYL